MIYYRAYTVYYLYGRRHSILDQMEMEGEILTEVNILKTMRGFEAFAQKRKKIEDKNDSTCILFQMIL